MSNIVKWPSSQSPQAWSQSGPQCWPPNCPPGPGVPPGCGCDGGGWGGLMQCWQDIAQFQQFLQCMLSQMGPLALQGVTDGSVAKAGQVGEVIRGSSSQTYLGNPTATQWVPQSPLVVPPGDWNLWAYMSFSTGIGGCEFLLSPQPAGVSNPMTGQSFVTGTTVLQSVNIIGQMAVGSFSVPTLLTFGGNINNSTDAGIVGGTGILTVEGRRMR